MSTLAAPNFTVIEFFTKTHTAKKNKILGLLKNVFDDVVNII